MLWFQGAPPPVAWGSRSSSHYAAIDGDLLYLLTVDALDDRSREGLDETAQFLSAVHAEIAETLFACARSIEPDFVRAVRTRSVALEPGLAGAVGRLVRTPAGVTLAATWQLTRHDAVAWFLGNSFCRGVVPAGYDLVLDPFDEPPRSESVPSFG